MFVLVLLGCKPTTDVLLSSLDENAAQQALASLADESIWLAKSLKERSIRFKAVSAVDAANLRTSLQHLKPITRHQAIRALGAITNDPEAYFNHLERSTLLWKKYLGAKNLYRLDKTTMEAQMSLASAQVKLQVDQLVEEEKKNSPMVMLHDCFSCSFSGPNGSGYMSPAQYRPDDNEMVEDATRIGGGGDMDAMGICSRTVNVALDRCRRDLDAGLAFAMVTFIGSDGKEMPGYLESIVEAGYAYWTCFEDGIQDFDLCAMDAGYYKIN